MKVPKEIMKYGYLLPISQTTQSLIFIVVEGHLATGMWVGRICECGNDSGCVSLHCAWWVCVCLCVVMCEDRMSLWAYKSGCPWVRWQFKVFYGWSLENPNHFSFQTIFKNSALCEYSWNYRQTNSLLPRMKTVMHSSSINIWGSSRVYSFLLVSDFATWQM